ncbi:MAG: restriction endonuclease [Lachnospiraceae bacterium]|nr:restriction endonuclease [Lachnospiraceae bacterium]
MDYIVEYDRSDPISIETYSQKMVGKTFREIREADEARRPMISRGNDADYGQSDVSETKRNKGNLGQIIEERFFHYACNSDSRADFYEAGVELKVTPYRINKNGTLSAKERLILTMIDYFQVVNESFEESHFWNKSRLILLVYYLYLKEIKYNLDYKIGYSQLFTPPEQDVKIIRHDYYTIVSKIKAGKAHELSEGDTLYLGAAPKAATSKDRRKQPFNDELAKPRAFAFKSSYMTYVLNTYIVPGKATYELIVQDEAVDSFEDYVVEKINRYRGYAVNDLCIEFDVERAKKPKNLEAILAYRILGIKGNHAEEFEKANVVVKTIRIGRNNKIKESMSFPAFRFKELIQEEWKDSTFGNYLRETRFFFVVYKFDKDNVLRLCGCQFWNIPYENLENDVRIVWERTKKVIQDGLQVTMINGVRKNNLPKASENPVCHVRPHAQNAKDTYELPDGRHYPKQCFWLNNNYIYDQLVDEIKVDQTR